MLECIVIGAGPGGIVSTKELLERGFSDTVCLEQSDDLGGVFSNSYDGLKLTSSAVFSMFSDFEIAKGQAHYFWSKAEAVQYWRDYAAHFGVTSQIRFNTKVTKVLQVADAHWEVQIKDGPPLHCRHLVLAVGNNNTPRFPEWASQLEVISSFHAKAYVNADKLQGKRVLIIGGGESASDIALEVSKTAAQCWVSLRRSTGWVTPRKRGAKAADVSTHRGVWTLPRSYGAKLSALILQNDRAANDPVLDALASLNERVAEKNGIWGTYGTKTIALPKAMVHHGCKIVGEVGALEDALRQITTEDGELLQNVDTVIFCTGYKTDIPFMPEGLQNVNPRQLFKHIFHPEYGSSLAFIGLARPAFGSQFPIMEIQARYSGHIFANELKLPSDAATEASIALDSRIFTDQFEHNAQSIPSLVDYFKYMDDLASLIGCKPTLFRYFLTKPRLWFHLVYGPMQATQFRLNGSGAKAKQAQKVVKNLPVSPFNHVVKAGLVGRIELGFSKIIPKAIWRYFSTSSR